MPGDIAAAAGIGPGSVCRMQYVNGVIAITPVDGTPATSIEDYAGLARGAWGASEAEIELRISADRDSWQR